MASGGANHLKILFVGPCDSGKSLIVNTLADNQHNAGPTVGVRVLEYDDTETKSYDDVVELWDCSGKQNYEKCFAALHKDAVGVVYVYNPDQPGSVEGLEYWYEHFGPRQLNLTPQCMMVVQVVKTMREYAVPAKIAFGSIQQPLTMTHEEVGRKMKPAFQKYLQKVFKALQDRQRQEEEDIMKL